MWKAIFAIILSTILTVLLLLSFMVPYIVLPIAIAFIVIILVLIFFGVEDSTKHKKLVNKTFYCPFRKKYVEVEFRPSFFTYRQYDDVIKCSAFNGKVTCKKECLDLPELQSS